MYDPDQQSPVLRLGSISKTPSLTTSERLALAERQMEEAVARWSEAFIAWQAERRQSQPISAARPVGDGMMRYERPMVFRQNGSVEPLDGFHPLDAPL